MNINLDYLWKLFKELGEEGLTCNHHELATLTEEHDPEVWKHFLLTPEVDDYISTEIKLMRKAELNKLTQGISQSHSVGQAQLIGALNKLNEDTTTKEGPIFIYSYVPLNAEQEQSPNVNILKEDPFIDKERMKKEIEQEEKTKEILSKGDY